ncbi:MAG: methyltransferase domain-containing protein [Thiothrix sp.]|uniref:class I SAM-dependent methyltransferase n=1 Tax=Thiothrix sp. TaxID=1032 RepID=UPI0026287CCC|nr:methyltransferase domain-containing protein [Thiothrix sp.]MDD5394682.1 methyltransferase domain-containing protein [Thiothrix sp.]
MGINLEYITLLSSLKARGHLSNKGKVLEFGAQDISAEPSAAANHARRCGVAHSCSSIDSARILYELYGLSDYTCIDATAEHGALAYDLNTNLHGTYGFTDTFDLVTDLGTFEHVFDIASAFRNAHEACKPDGLMIHALPSNCNANHGYYAIQPRMIADVAAANGYEIIDFVFTVDYHPILYQFNLENYRNYDDRDLMIYSVLRKKTDAPFQLPFDSIFTEKNTLTDYQPLFASLAFSSYIKSTWGNVRPIAPEEVPTDILALTSRYRSWIKRIVNRIGGFC